MKTVVFSKSLELPEATDVDLLVSRDAASIDAIRRRSAGPIYLCSGGAFAGSLLAMGQIDPKLTKKRTFQKWKGSFQLLQQAERPIPTFAASEAPTSPSATSQELPVAPTHQTGK